MQLSRIKSGLKSLSVGRTRPYITLSTAFTASRVKMPAKQGTLKYVRPSQQTLSKWFSGPGASSSPAEQQQTKLQFKAKEQTQAQNHAVTNGEAKANHKKEEVVKEEDEDMVDEAKPSSTTNGAKSPRKNIKKEELEEDEEDDEPVRKKRKTAKATAAPTKSSRNGTVSPASHRKTNGARTYADESNEAELPVRPSPSAKKSTKTAPAKVQEEQSASEHDVMDEEAEENEIKSDEEDKARQKVLVTLKGSGKDPYPDWKAGDPVPYAALCQTFHKIEMTTKRLEILAHCSLFLRQVMRLSPDDLLETVLLMVNKLGADYSGVELGIGESLIMKAIGDTTGRSLAVIKADQNVIGDLGLVATKSKSTQSTMIKPKPLTVPGVFRGLKEIAVIEGQGAQGRKIAGIKKLLSAADTASVGKNKGFDINHEKGGPSEAKYIVRTLEGKLRLGLAEKSVLVALAQAIVFHRTAYMAAKEGKTDKPPSSDAVEKGERILKTVYSELPAYEVIVPAVIASNFDVDKLHDKCKLQPGIPLKPMLAKPTKAITEVLDRFEGKHFTCEYKYDGERAQIHYVAHDSTIGYATDAPSAGKSERGVSNVFSRNSEDLSKKYPDILAKLPTWVKQSTKSFVLDCESVAWDVKEKKVLPFQQLMTRKRKDVKIEEVTVKVCVFAFDLLYLNGEALVEKPFRQRRELLHQSFNSVEGEFAFATYGDGEELDDIQTMLDESVKASCEGLMVKMLDGPESSYEPSKRSQNWLKVKKDYLAGVGDSLDLVVLGAYFGRGKRTSWYGAFLLACYNSSNDTYETVCNIGTGFSEEVLADLHDRLSKATIAKPKPFYVHSSGNKDQPDVWFEPRFVWEVKTADLTVSPRYRAAAGDVTSSDGKGISLRFPRFIKERDDKKPEQATTSRAVAEMYMKQESVAKNKGPSVDDDFEY